MITFHLSARWNQDPRSTTRYTSKVQALQRSKISFTSQKNNNFFSWLQLKTTTNLKAQDRFPKEAHDSIRTQKQNGSSGPSSSLTFGTHTDRKLNNHTTTLYSNIRNMIKLLAVSSGSTMSLLGVAI